MHRRLTLQQSGADHFGISREARPIRSEQTVLRMTGVQARRDRDALRREQSPHRKLYDLAIWRGPTGLRQQQLARQPLCERCLSQGKTTPATTVNHRKPHKGDWSLFIDPANHESVCKHHHDTLIQREEARGHVIGSDVSGMPLDPSHPWNR